MLRCGAPARTGITYDTWYQRLPEASLPALPAEVDLRVIDPTGKNTDYVTDDIGRLAKVISPDTGTTIFNHDEAGNVIWADRRVGCACEPRRVRPPPRQPPATAPRSAARRTPCLAPPAQSEAARSREPAPGPE
jgi:hypothetical protein